MNHLDHLHRLGANCPIAGVGNISAQQQKARGDRHEAEDLEDQTSHEKRLLRGTSKAYSIRVLFWPTRTKWIAPCRTYLPMPVLAASPSKVTDSAVRLMMRTGPNCPTLPLARIDAAQRQALRLAFHFRHALDREPFTRLNFIELIINARFSCRREEVLQSGEPDDASHGGNRVHNQVCGLCSHR